MRVLYTLLFMMLWCWTASAQGIIVSSVDYEHELAYYRPRIALSADGAHAVAWESFRKLRNTEEWQISVQKFDAGGAFSREVIHLQDPANCLRNEEGGGRGVQNADIHFGTQGQLIVAMEPVVDVQRGSYQEKRSRMIVSRINGVGRVFSSGNSAPCQTSALPSRSYPENQRPQLGVLPGSDRYIAVGNSSEAVRNDGAENYSLIASANYRPNSPGYSRYAGQYYDAWYDVATNGSLSAYSWQRCPIINEFGDSEECDILVKFESHSTHEQTLHETQPMKVNMGDKAGVLNYKPSIAMNRRGQSVVVWVDYRYDADGDILAQRFDTTGWPVGENIRVSNDVGVIDDLDGIGPEVAILDDGSFMIVWTERRRDLMHAVGREFDAHGMPRVDPFLLHGEEKVETGQADVASNGSRFAYTWISHEETGGSIYYFIPGVEMVSREAAHLAKENLTFSGYPNPFSHETTLRYELKSEGHVTLVIYDLLGREVKTLIDKWQAPGSYLVNVSAEDLAVGYYVTKLQQGDYQSSKVLIRSQ